MQREEITKLVPKGTPVMAMSSTAHRGLKEVLRALREKVDTARAKEAEKLLELEEQTEGLPVISLSSEAIEAAWTVEKDGDVFVVRGEKIERFARRTNYDQFEGVNRLRDIMKKLGIIHELRRKGAQSESIIRIGVDEFTLVEQRD
jgi:GTP-binding protein